jgi:T-complex protein 1 subunit theta
MFAPQGFQALLKDGGQHFAGVDEAIVKNIDACKKIGQITSTSLGPNGMNKLLVNHLGKHIVTSDTAMIMETLEVMHPAAKLLVMASKACEQECGDATNLCVSFGAALLEGALDLLKEGIHLSEIIRGYQLANEKCIEYIKGNVCWTVDDVRSTAQLSRALVPVINAKQVGFETFLAELVAQACVQVMPSDPKKFDTDCIRVAKVTGSTISKSQVINGMALVGNRSGGATGKQKARVAIFGVGLEMSGTETKGTVLLNSAEELLNYSKTEEAKMEEFANSLVEAKIDVVIAMGAIQDIAVHYLNKHKIMFIKVTSKFELKRLAKALNAIPLVRLGKPLPEEIGYAEDIAVNEIAGTKVIVVQTGDSKIATLLIRGATSHLLDEVERAIDDSVNLVRMVATKDGRFVPGGGATEIETAHRLQQFGATVSGLEQYGVLKFAETFEIVPKVLSRNAGLNETKVVTSLYAAHAEGNKNACVNLESMTPIDAEANGILDHAETKTWAIRLAVDAALTVLSVDNIIVAKQAGGPKVDKPYK